MSTANAAARSISIPTAHHRLKRICAESRVRIGSDTARDASAAARAVVRAACGVCTRESEPPRLCAGTAPPAPHSLAGWIAVRRQRRHPQLASTSPGPAVSAHRPGAEGNATGTAALLVSRPTPPPVAHRRDRPDAQSRQSRSGNANNRASSAGVQCKPRPVRRVHASPCLACTALPSRPVELTEKPPYLALAARPSAPGPLTHEKENSDE